MTEKKSTTQQTPPTFEDALKRLETLAAEMESGKLALDDMLGAFSEGQKLIQFCNKKLNEVEKKIEALVKNPDGTLGPDTELFPDTH